jgi:chromosome partitioning protein
MQRPQAEPRKILVLNPKGGSGKTTVATNLAAYYALQGLHPTLLDLDSQGSSTRWLSKRSEDAPPIHGIRGFDIPANVTRTFAMRPPDDCERLVVDTAASVSAQEMVPITRDAYRILIPVLPSDIDIHAAARCVADLLLIAKIPRAENRIAVVANRVKRNTLVFRSLMRFLQSLQIPVAGVLRDAQNYVRAFESGQSIHELKGGTQAEDQRQWQSILSWLEDDQVPAPESLWEDPERENGYSTSW